MQYCVPNIDILEMPFDLIYWNPTTYRQHFSQALVQKCAMFEVSVPSHKHAEMTFKTVVGSQIKAITKVLYLDTFLWMHKVITNKCICFFLTLRIRTLST